MAFKKSAPKATAPDSPEKLIMDLPRRKIKGVLLHQGEIMKEYGQRAVAAPDVALQLPTGSGKTLVGLLIAEWRRRKFQERVIYLCPTRQLVNQVVEQAEEKYGLTVRGFTGRVADYDPSAQAEYQTADKVAVTTYNALFNTNPYFKAPHVVIVDDAHAAENYIASMWTIRVDRSGHVALHATITALLRDHLEPSDYFRLTGQVMSVADASWVEKIPTPTLSALRHELTSIFDTHTQGTELRHSWSLLRDHVEACHLYLTPNEILLRPLLPPTWSHAPFEQAKQRIFMSATLGAGGDLERLTGRSSITRLKVPDGWDRQGIGRRYFIFPGMSLTEAEQIDLRHQLMQKAGRSLFLVPSDKAREDAEAQIKSALGYETFSAADIESSKKDFVVSPKAVAVVANRYDGIDFPGDDCRLLFVDGLPRAMNAQERFLMSRMAANALFNERVQTRVLQAIGRCTRSPEDYSAIVVTGDDLPDYLADRDRRQHFHPELQAELEFGIDQSKTSTVSELVDNFRIFIENGIEWEQANDQIINLRDQMQQRAFPAMDDLAASVAQEVDYQRSLWQGDYETALGAAEAVLAKLKAPELRGYRALWHYLAGSSAWLGAQRGISTLKPKAQQHFTEAKKAATGIPWLVALSRFQDVAQPANEAGTANLMSQIERVEALFERLGTLHSRKYDEFERVILGGLLDSNHKVFEEAHRKLGELLGYEAGNHESDAAPDPWWIAGKICVVFEDHANAAGTSTLGATKVRQAIGHPAWIRANIPNLPEDAAVIPVIITPVRKVEAGAVPHLKGLSAWPLSEFQAWAKEACATLRTLKTSFSAPGDLVWRAEAANEFIRHKLDSASLNAFLKTKSAADYFETNTKS